MRMEELPNVVLDRVFSLCDKPALAVLPTVCRLWQHVFSKSVTVLPALRLCGPLHDAWMRDHARRLFDLTLRRVEDLDWASCMRNLQFLVLAECRHLEDLSPLTQLNKLQHVKFSSCHSLRDLTPLMGVPQLQRLTIDRCFARDLSSLSGHPGLQELHLAYDCWSVMHLRLPDRLPALKRVRIMSAIQDIGPLACFTGLQELEVYCVSVYDLSPLRMLAELQRLDLHTLQEANGLHADSLSHLSALSKLRALGLQGSDASIVDACPWQCLTGLTHVDLHGSCVSDLGPLKCLAGLRALDLTEARALIELDPLSSLENLSELILTGCRRIRELRPVLHLLPLGGLKKP